MKNLNDFLGSYGELNDALIHSISILYKNESKKPLILIKIECKSIINDYNWHFIEINFFDVSEFNISERNSSNQVISNFSANHWGDKLIFNFSPNVVPSESVEEHRGSSLYLICENFDWRVLSENNLYVI